MRPRIHELKRSCALIPSFVQGRCRDGTAEWGGGERAPRARSGRVNDHLGVQRPLRQRGLQLADQVVLAEGGLRITAGQQLVPRIIYATIFQ